MCVLVAAKDVIINSVFPQSVTDSTAVLTTPSTALSSQANGADQSVQVTSEGTMYTPSIPDGLLPVSVTVSESHGGVVQQPDIDHPVIQPPVEVSEVTGGGKMWSASVGEKDPQSGPLIMLGGESVAVGDAPPTDPGGHKEDEGLMGGDVHEEVVLLSNQEQ